jgi:hypothetical protein
MPEEIEVPTEHLHETMEHESHKAHGAHGGEHGGGAEKHHSWVPGVAVSSALVAVAAAIAALLAGHHANEGVLENIKAANSYSYEQATKIKQAVLQSKVEMLAQLDKQPKDEDIKHIAKYQDQLCTIETQAAESTVASEQHMDHHNIFARTVTLFQIAIALGAISVLSKKKWLWFCSLALAAAGTFFLVQSFLPVHEKEEKGKDCAEGGEKGGGEKAPAPTPAEGK